MRDMADELLKLYAERRMAEGFSFSSDSNWQREFEDAFEYGATKDQISAVKEIKPTWNRRIRWTGYCAAMWGSERPKSR